MIIRVRDSKEDNQKFIDRFGEERFAKFQRLKPAFSPEKRDLYFWLDKTREELEKEFNKPILKGYEPVAENDEWLVVKCDNQEMVNVLAGDMPWCIKEGDEFDVALEHGIEWYLFLNKNDRRNKIMVANQNGSCEITDKQNHRISEIPNAPEGFDFKSNLNDDSFMAVLEFIVGRDDEEELVNKFGEFFGNLDLENENFKEDLLEKLRGCDLTALGRYIDSNIRKFV